MRKLTTAPFPLRGVLRLQARQRRYEWLASLRPSLHHACASLWLLR